jgi:sulfur carrier protein
MTITLNGEKREVADGLTVEGLLRFLNIERRRVAVEVNEHIVKKDGYEATALKDGDSVEVVSFMGGGAEEVQRSKCKVQSDGKEQN